MVGSYESKNYMNFLIGQKYKCMGLVKDILMIIKEYKLCTTQAR